MPEGQPASSDVGRTVEGQWAPGGSPTVRNPIADKTAPQPNTQPAGPSSRPLNSPPHSNLNREFNRMTVKLPPGNADRTGAFSRRTGEVERGQQRR